MLIVPPAASLTRTCPRPSLVASRVGVFLGRKSREHHGTPQANQTRPIADHEITPHISRRHKHETRGKPGSSLYGRSKRVGIAIKDSPKKKIVGREYSPGKTPRSASTVGKFHVGSCP